MKTINRRLLFSSCAMLLSFVFSCHSDKETTASKSNEMPGMEINTNAKKSASQNGGLMHSDQIIQPVNETVLSVVKTIKIRRRSLQVVIEASGYIAYNPENTSAIASRYTGRIDKLYVKYNYQQVVKGQKLLEIYSPELLTAEQNLIFMLANDSNDATLLNAAMDKLKLLGMTGEQIKTLTKNKKTTTLLSVQAPVTGHIHEMNNLPRTAGSSMGSTKNGESQVAGSGQSISIKEGDYVQKGQTIFTVFNTNRLWAILKIYAENLAVLKVNQPVEIYTESQPGLVYRNKVGFIETAFDQDSKYLNIRVYLDSCNHKNIAVGSLIKGKINVGSRYGIWINKSSVIDLGNNIEVVFIKSGQIFKTHKIHTGIVSGGDVEVLEGLNAKDEIAVDAQYLIDSESFVKVN